MEQEKHSLDKKDFSDEINRRINRINRLKHKQFLSDKTGMDVNILLKFAKNIDTPEGWRKEKKFSNIFPAIWFFKEKYLIQVFSRMEVIVVVFSEVSEGEIDDIDDDNLILCSSPVLPPCEIKYVYKDKKSGELYKDYKRAAKIFKRYIGDCLAYIKYVKQDDDFQKRQFSKKYSFDNEEKERLQGFYGIGSALMY